jgi:hypothetical protein
MLVGVAQGSTYYVATNGSDTNPGSLTAPLATIQRAVNLAVAGDAIIVRDGTYPGPCGTVVGSAMAVLVTKAYSATAHLTITAEHPGAAILDGRNICRAYIELSRAQFVDISGFEIKQDYEDGIFIPLGSNLTVSHCTIHHIGNHISSTSGGMTGILTGAATFNITVDGNVFHDIGRTMPGSTNDWHDQNFYMEGSNNTATHNVFYNMLAGWAIAAKVGSNYEIAYNTFYGPVGGGRSGQIVVGDDLGGSMSGVNIHHNNFINPRGGGIALCFVALTGASAWTNNTYFGPGVTALQAADACGGSTGQNTITQTGNANANLFTRPAAPSGLAVTL